MYNRSRFTDELTKEQMESARRAFIGLLHRRAYSPQFILDNGEELLALAHTEYVRALDKGVEIEEPVAWTVNCAWRRTQNLLTAESRRPPAVSSEELLELADDKEPGPEEILEEAERARKIREAVARLNEAQRQVVALTYFEGMSVREAARRLGWHPSKAQYAHKTAIKSLFENLGVSSSDALEIEIGLAAFLTFGAHAGAVSMPAGVEAVLDRAAHGATGVWGRLQDAARRLGPGGGDAAGAITSSGAGRAAGACAAGVAALCLGAASGVIGGTGLGGGSQTVSGPQTPTQAKILPPAGGAQPQLTSDESEGTTTNGTSTPSGEESSSGTSSSKAAATNEHNPAAGISQTRRQWRGTDRALLAAESSGTESSGEAATASASDSAASPSSSEKEAAKGEFNAFAKAR